MKDCGEGPHKHRYVCVCVRPGRGRSFHHIEVTKTAEAD